MLNLYNVLGVSNFSSEVEIKIAYRKLSKKFHPDLNQGDEFFAKKFIEIQEAYDILLNSTKRNIYDQKLKVALYGTTQDYRQSDPKTNPKAQPNTTPEPEHKQSIPEKEHQTENNTNKTDSTKNGKAASTIFIWLVFIAIVSFGFYATQIEDKKDPIPTYKPSDNYVPSPTIDQSAPTKLYLYHPREETGSSYTLGATKKQVIAAEGTPSSIHKSDYDNSETWFYGTSMIEFKKGKVYEYSNGNDNLHIELGQTYGYDSDLSNQTYSLGATKKQVFQIQGTPSSIHKSEYDNSETWFYGTSMIEFKNGKLKQYSNGSINLMITLE